MKRKCREQLKKVTALLLCFTMVFGNMTSIMAEDAGTYAAEESKSADDKPAPATEAPQVTEAPATEAPQVTEAPATEAPATEAPQVTEAPTEAPQATEAPATEAPQVTEAPATEAPQATEEQMATVPVPVEGVADEGNDETASPSESNGDEEGQDPVRVNPRLTVSEGDDARADAADDKLVFTATANAALGSGEDLPEGADYVYTYKWQYAQRKYSWWGTEQTLSESDWKDCVTGDERETLDDGSYNPFYGSETEVSGTVGKLTLSLPEGADRRTVLSKLTVRCEVSVQVKAGDKEYSEKVSATTDRMNVNVADALLQCTLTAVVDGTNVAINNSGDTITWNVKPVLENAPKSGTVSYTYEWQYYNEQKGTWYAYNYSGTRKIAASPIKTATVDNRGADGCTLSYPFPALVSDRETLQGLKVRCKVTTTTGGGVYSKRFPADA